MLQTLQAAMESVGTLYHEFLLGYSKSKKIVYGFVEGKTDPYFYKYLIQNQLPVEWEIKVIASGNKRQVLEAMKQFDWNRFEKKQICFYIDRDLQDYFFEFSPTASNLFVTPGYSVENMVFKSELVVEALCEIYKICNVNDIQKKTINSIVSKNTVKFFQSMIPVMAQVLIWRSSYTTAYLDNFKLSNCYEFLDGKIKCASKSDILKSLQEDSKANLSDQKLLDSVAPIIKAKIYSGSLIRGKWLAWFFVENVKAIAAAIDKICPGIKPPVKKNIEVGAANSLLFWGPRARITNCLKAFIHDNYLAFIAAS